MKADKHLPRWPSIFFVLGLLLAPTASTAAPSETILFGLNQVWKYDQSGTDNGTIWRSPAFDDSGWTPGNGVFAQDDSPLLNGLTNTLLTLGPVTYYFRTTFNFGVNPAGYTLVFSNILDDGAVFYLNGVEINRLYMTNATSIVTYASTALSTEATNHVVFTLSGPVVESNLVTGLNRLAVEVHQNSAASSDVAFGLALSAFKAPIPPAVSLTAPTNGAILSSLANLTLSASASDSNGLVTLVQFYDGANLLGQDASGPFSLGVNLAPGIHSLAAVATDDEGAKATSAVVTITVKRPTLTMTAFSVGAGASLLVDGLPGQSASLESLASIAEASWSVMSGAIMDTNGQAVFTDPNAGLQPSRFYRIRVVDEILTYPDIVGIINLNVPTGYSLLSNPFLRESNLISQIVPQPSNGFTILKPQNNSFSAANYLNGWSDVNLTLKPGEGFWAVNPGGAMTLSFWGRVAQGGLTNNLPAGLSYAASIAPQAGSMTALNFPTSGDTTLYRWTGFSFNIHNYVDGFGWDIEPNLAVAQGFFVNISTPRAWTRTFSVTDDNAGYSVSLSPDTNTQGRLNFFTYNPSDSGKGRMFQADGATPLNSNFVAQVYAGTVNSEGSLAAVGQPVRLTTGALPGYANGGLVAIPGTASGQTVYWQVRVWDDAGGTHTTYEAAAAAVAPKGKSAVFSSTAGGSAVGVLPPAINTLASFNLETPPPAILVQPQSRSVVAGTNATFSVTASGALPLSYQWYVNNSLIPGAVNPSLTINNVQLFDSGGSYKVVVTNVGGSVTSQVAILTVTAPVSFTWNGGAGDWSTATNWTPNGVPGAADTAVANSGTVTVSDSRAIANFTFGGGTLNGAGTLTVNSTMNWTAGTMNSAGTTIIASNASLSISGAGAKILNNGRILINQGTVTWTGAGGMTSSSGAAIFNNNGVFDIQNNAPLANAGGSLVITNTGTFRKSAGAGTTTISTLFHNTNPGKLELLAGQLELATGGSGTGDYFADTGTTLSFTAASYTLNTGAAFTGAGTNQIAGATVNVEGNVTASSILSLTSGSLGGAGTLTVSNVMNWTGGTMNGAGTTIIATNATLYLSGTGNKLLNNGRILINHGTATWTGAGSIASTSGTGTINNYGLFDLQSGAPISNAGGTGVINNHGMFRKSAGNANTIAFSLNNASTSRMEVLSGQVDLTGGGTSAGEYHATTGATLSFSAGAHTLNTGAAFTGAGTNQIAGANVNVEGNVTASSILTMTSGTLGGAGTLTVSNLMHWTGGTMNGSGTTLIAANASLNLSGIGGKILNNGHILNNQGTVTWPAGSGSMSSSSGTSTLINSGLFDIQSNLTFLNTGGIIAITNNGTFRRSAGAGTTTIGFPFHNNGTVDLRSGIFQVNGNFNASPASTLSVTLGGPAVGTQFSQLSVSGTLNLNGGLRVLLTNSFSPNLGTTFQIITAGTRSGTFTSANGLDLGNGRQLVAAYQPGGVILNLDVQAGTLLHRYSFTSDASDSVGTAHGTIMNQATVNNGAITLNGTNQYVDLPNGLLTGMDSMTVEAWFTNTGTNHWTRLYDFGSSSAGEDFPIGTNGVNGTKYFFLTPRTQTDTVRGAVTLTGAGAGEEILEGPTTLLASNTETHVAWIYDANSQTARFYVNGSLVDIKSGITIKPSDLEPTVNNWLGRSQFSADAFLKANINEFRVYYGAVSHVQVAADYVAGPDNVRANPLSLKSLSLLADRLMVAGSTQQAVVLGSYSNVANINLMSSPGVTYVSSDTNVLAVNASGQLQAIAAGASLVTASYLGASTSVMFSVIASPRGLTHRYTFTTDARDAVGGAHGIPMNGAVANAGTLSLNGSTQYLDLPNNLVTGYTSITIEIWVTDAGSSNWARIYDFGNSSNGENQSGTGTQYMYLSLPSGLGRLRSAYTIAGGGGEQSVEWISGRPPVNQRSHIVWTSDGGTGQARLYVDGTLVGSNNAVSLTPAALGNTVNNWLGRSQYPDPYFKGSIDEFRIYTVALTTAEIQRDYQLGSELLAPDAGPPAFLINPVSRAAQPGSQTTFTVIAGGTAPMQIQWYRNNALVPGATSQSLTLNNVQFSDAGFYYAVASNSLGQTASTAAALSVQSSSATVNGLYQEFYGGISGGTVSALTNNANYPNNPTSTSLMTNSFENQNLGNNYGQRIRALVTAPESGSYMFWIASDDQSDLYLSSDATPANKTRIASVSTWTSFRGWFGSTNQQSAPIELVANEKYYIEALHAEGGGGTHLSVRWQWPSGTIEEPIPASRFTPYPLQGAQPPVVTQGPVSTTVRFGGVASFSVSVQAATGMAYQWSKDFVPIPGATNPLLRLERCLPGDAGLYSVAVSNASGVVMAGPARLEVVPECVLAPSDLLAWWEAEGNALDTVGFYHGVLSNGVQFAAGKRGAAFNLDGVDDFVASPGSTELFTPDALSIEAWIRPASVTTPLPQVIASKYNSDNNRIGWALEIFNGAAQWRLSADGTPAGTRTVTTSPGTIPANAWTHVVATFDGSSRSMRLFINGTESATTASGAAPMASVFNSLEPVRLGACVEQGGARTHFFGGLLDEVALYGRALGWSEILRLYQADAAGKCSPPQILAHPQDIEVVPGSNAAFTVVATGIAPLRYQWRHNGRIISGATNDTFSVANVQFADAGGYSVIVRDAAGAALSQTAFLLLNLPTLPFGDNFVDRFQTNLTMSSLSGFGRGYNAGATREVGEPQHTGKRSSNSVWFAFASPVNGIATLSLLGSGFDTLLAVYKGSNLVTMQPVSSDDDSAALGASAVRFNVDASVQYQVAIDSFNFSTGQVLLTWQIEATANRLPELTSQPADAITGEGADLNLNVGIAVIAQVEWFKNGDSVANTAQLSLNNVNETDVGTYLAVVTVNGQTTATKPIVVQFNRIDGRTDARFAARDKFLDSFDPALFTISPGLVKTSRKPFDRTSGPTRGYVGTQVFNTYGASSEEGEPVHCGIIGGASQWFTYQAPTNGWLTIHTGGSSYDTILAVYYVPGNTPPNSFADLVNITCDNNGYTNNLSLVSLLAEAETIYYIAVDGVAGGTGIARINYDLYTAPSLAGTLVNQVVREGGTASFTNVTATGTNLYYQWLHNAASLASATNAILVLTNLQGSQAGNYQVAVANNAGSITSSVGTLTVLGNLQSAGKPVVTNGQLRLVYQNLATDTYLAIQGTTNLVNWFTLYSNTPAGSTYEFVVPASSNRLFLRSIQGK